VLLCRVLFDQQRVDVHQLRANKLSVQVYTYLYIYIYICVCVCVCVLILLNISIIGEDVLNDRGLGANSSPGIVEMNFVHSDNGLVRLIHSFFARTSALYDG